MNDLLMSKGWRRVKLGEVCKLKNGFAFKSTEYKSEGIPVIRISDINSGSVTPDKSVRVKAKNEYEEYVVQENEILVAMSGATTGKFGIFKSKERAYQNQRVGKFQILNKRDLSNEFLLYQLHALKRQIEKDAYGGAQPNISSKKIEEMEISIAPLPTQLAIVSKIEELFSELDKGIEQLKTAQQQLKTYRQAVLKWAFEGKLTNENVKEGELPEGWKMVKLNEVGKLFCGQSSPVGEVNKIGKGTIYVTGPEQWDGKHIEQTKWTISPKRIVPNGTIFITVKGAGVGKMFPGISCAIGRDIYAYLPSADLNFKFSYYALKHSIDLVIAKAQGDIPGLAKNHILEHEIGICSIEEQERTVQAIESRLSVADKLEESINNSLQQAEALRQSILKKAFEGRLINN